MSSLIDKNILLVSPEGWGHIFVSKHHYAVHLAKKRNRVFFLNPPSEKYRTEHTDTPDLTVLDYTGLWKGLRFFPKFIRKYNQKNVFEKLEKQCNCRFDIIWSFDNSVFYDFDALPERVKKISHIVDLNQDFNTKRASSSADICFGVVTQIVNRHKKYNSNSHLIRHALNTQAVKKEVKLPGNNFFKILYFGNLGMKHLNWDMMIKATQIDSVDFIFIGENNDLVPKNVRDQNHVFILPKVHSYELGSYMKAASLLILFYKPSFFDDCASPHKVLEYLSSGKPILSMEIQEYARIPGLIQMAETEEGWLQILRSICAKKDTYSNDSMALKRLRFANQNTYSKRISEIESILYSLA